MRFHGSRTCRQGRWLAVAFVACGLVAPRGARAQQADSTRAVPLAPVVVTAERVLTPLAGSIAAVSRVAPVELRALPVRSVADALETVPGLTFLDVDGAGYDPQLTVRGFYGGGEAEYVQVLLDGRPLNGLESGLFDWDMIPLSAVESIEVVRGGASSLYGDAAVGGVINLVTAGGTGRGARVSLGGGSLGLLRGTADARGSWGGRPVSLFGAVRRADGFRAHAERTTGSVGASLGLLRGPRGELSVSTLHHWRQYDEPGPLTGEALTVSRTAVDPFYRFDTSDEGVHRLSLDGRGQVGGGAEAAGYLAGELRSTDGFRTLPLSPDFADTKERVLHTARLLGSAQVRWGEGVLPLGGALLLGTDWSLGRLRNEHYQVLTGDAAAYRASVGRRGALDARGEGTRLAGAGFARYELHPVEVIRLTAGARLDWLRDRFTPGLPEGERQRNTHLALSPQAGVNVRWLRTPTQEGNLFANVGRSFKAPTPDQLFDQRAIPLPIPPYRLTLSNPDLDPARGTSMEAGLYHRARLLPQRLDASLSLAVYQLDMEDELDIDLESFRYVNIGRSRHRGVEAGVALAGPRGLGAHASYTLQAATFRYGPNEGNALKAIPRHSLSVGVRAGSSTALAGSLVAQTVRGIWLDDANTLSLPGYTRVDGRISYPFGRVRLDAQVRNLFDRAYSTTGYPDPSGSGLVYYYPAAGRVLELGVTAEW